MAKKQKKKNSMKTLVKIIITLAILLALCVVAVTGVTALKKHTLDQKIADVEAANKKKEEAWLIAKAEYENATRSGENLSWPAARTEGWDVVDLTTFPVENATRVTMDRQSLLTGGLMLINQWHAIPADFSDAALSSVRGATNSRVPVRDNNVKLFPVASEALDMLIMDANLQGLEDYIVQNAYRTNEEQTNLWNKVVERLSKRFDGETLTNQAKKEVNYPGTSDYQSGFSFDMKLYKKGDTAVTNADFEDTPQGQYFNENCWKYGIIFRFPTKDHPTENTTDKSYKTGVSVALNLYRYVGEAHAAAMRALDMCMEEYIEYLIQHPHLAIYENGELRYEIYRQAYADEETFEVPVPQAAARYTASVDNMGGVVSAYTYE